MVEIISCPECGAETFPSDKACPNCKAAIQRTESEYMLPVAPKKSMQKKIAIAAACAVALLFCTFMVGRSIGHAQSISAKEVDMIEAKSKKYQEAEEKVSAIRADLNKNSSQLRDFDKYRNDLQGAKDTLADLKQQETATQANVAQLQANLDAKQKELDLATANVTKATGEPKYLPAGNYTVGSHIPSGRYVIRGKSNFFVRDSSGGSLINIILGGNHGVPEYVATIKDGMTIETSGGANFTPTN